MFDVNTPLPMWLWNGDIVAVDQVCISPLDRGFLFGDAVYEVIPWFQGRALRLHDHIERLLYSLQQLGIPNPYTTEKWQRLLTDLVAANGGGRQGLYLQVTRGVGPDRNFLPPNRIQPTVMGFCWALKPRSNSADIGLKAVLLEDLRWARCDIKTSGLTGAVLLRKEAAAQGADEAILTRNGRLTEGSSSAIFLVRDNTVFTPPISQERLPSITREIVVDVVHSLGLPFAEREVQVEELTTADEIWLASATRDVAPVIRLNQRAVGSGTPGVIWKQVNTEFQNLKRQEGLQDD